MAKKKISELPAGGALNGTELVPIVQTGTTKRITAQDIANLGNASGVEGSGTINYLAKFTATSTIGNSLLFDNGTSIGLGTATPSATYKLDIIGGLRATTIVKSGGTSAEYLKADGSVSTLTNPITGTGTTNYLPKFTGASALGNSNIQDSGSLVSIGVSTLINNGTANQNTQIFGNKVGMSRTSDGAEVVYFSKTAELGIFQGTANIFGYDGIQFRTQGSETVKATITSAGNVGIGTTSPSRLLNISGAGTDGTQLQINGTVDSAGIKLIPTTGDNWEIQANVSNQFFIYNRTDSAYRFLIDNTGNVGIGTTSPQAKLHSNADILTGYFQNGTNGIYDALILTNNTASNTLSGNGARIQFYNNSNNSTNLIGSSIRSVNVDYGWASNLVLSSVRNNGYATQTAIDSLTLTNNGSAIFASNIGWGGITPVGDGANCSTIEGANGAQIAARNGFAQLYIGSNVVGTPYAPIRSVAGYATQLSLDALGGTISLNRAVSGAAGSAISWINNLVFDNTGAATFSSSVKVGSFTTTQINALSASAGMVVYNTTLATLCFYDGSGWRKVSHSSM